MSSSGAPRRPCSNETLPDAGNDTPPSPGHAPPLPTRRRRANAEQLAYLQRIFAVDKFPDAAKRKEISDLLGITERQTQIWFQSRRAQARLLESRNQVIGAAGDTHASESSRPPLDTAPDAELRE